MGQRILVQHCQALRYKRPVRSFLSFFLLTRPSWLGIAYFSFLVLTVFYVVMYEPHGSFLTRSYAILYDQSYLLFDTPVGTILRCCFMARCSFASCRKRSAGHIQRFFCDHAELALLLSDDPQQRIEARAMRLHVAAFVELSERPVKQLVHYNARRVTLALALALRSFELTSHL